VVQIHSPRPSSLNSLQAMSGRNTHSFATHFESCCPEAMAPILRPWQRDRKASRFPSGEARDRAAHYELNHRGILTCI
jgi:hypothetical protein